MSRFLEFVNNQVLLLDGAMGTQIQGASLTVEEDYWGQENCSEILNLSRPDFIRNVHMKYLSAGSDAVETNTFGGSHITLGEFGLEDKTIEINRRACELAHEAIAEFKDGRQRFVIGAIGPGTKLPSLGHIGFDELEKSFALQAEGLLQGDADAFLIETSQDPLQIKSAIAGIRSAQAKMNRTLPIMVQVTVETTGTMLVGSDIAAAATIIHAMGVDVMGLNCATGPQEMADHVRWLSQNWPNLISVLPNAGLPEMHQGHVHFPLSPDEMAKWMERFLKEDGINIIGGCCGTNENHIAALNGMLEKQETGKRRPAPVKRTHHWVPAVASLFLQSELRQDNAVFAIGERCNANGSKKFRVAQENEDWDTCVDMAKEQVREGSHALDICTAFVGRDEVRDMTEIVTRLRGTVTAPLVIDSTELIVLEAALKLYGGKAIINSINFEDGEEPAHKRMQLAKKYGAAVIALTIDEQGMAKDVDRKLEIAHRLYKFCCEGYGLPASDLLIDPLTFTICTGNEDDRKLGLWTLEAIERIHKELPDIQIILGLSNISFGLNPPARHVLNSVYLDHAQKRGMTGAIIHVSKIAPLHKVPKHEADTAEDLIFDRRLPKGEAA